MPVSFAKPEFLLYGLAAVLLMGLFFYLTEKRAWRRLSVFAASGLLERLTGNHSRRRLWFKNGLLLAAVWMGFASLARPQWGATWEKAETRGIDIMIALDTSRSMLAEDVSPNRLERSKLAILDLLESIRGDRVGLIAFAGNAFLQCPLTLDYQAFRQTLNAVNTGTIPRGGTDVAAAIDEAEAYFEKSGNERLLILITDGEDLEASGVQRAREAAKKGTRVLTVGVGSTEGELIPVTGPGGQRDYLRDPSGKPVSTALDASTLRRIAEVSNGLYAPLGPTGSGLERVYEFSLSQIESRSRQESLQRIPIERYQWSLVPALVLLLVETLLTTRRRKAAAFRGWTASLGIFLLPGVCLFTPAPLEAGTARDAARAYQEERYEESVSLYRQALEEDPDDQRLEYNLGVSAYRAGRYEEAIASFEKVLRSTDRALQAKGFHNLGNSRTALGFEQLEDHPESTRDQWTAALKDFENALALEEDRENSRRNLQALQSTIAAHTHTIATEASPPEGGSVSPGGAVFHNVPFPIQAKAAEGWVFDKWEGHAVEDPQEPATVARLQEDATVTARFVKTWNLTVLSEDESMGTAGKSGTYREDEPVRIQAQAKDYFAFSKWRAEGVEIPDPAQAETEITLTGDATATATFVPAFKLSVEIDPEIGGQAGPSGFFEEYSVVPIQAQPRDGFEWIGWVGDGIKEPKNRQTTISLTADRIAIARMERVWNLVIVPTPEEGGTTQGAGNHPVGSTVDISATPAEGFTFQGWEGPGVADPKSPRTSVTVQSTTHTLFARFEKSDQDQNQDQQDQQDQQQQDQQDQQQQDQQDQQQDQQDQQQQDQQQPADPSERPEKLPGEMSREEARQLLNALSEDERFLPAGEHSREEEQREPPTGRNW